jgi:predicted Fe-S protein YdhL (DUF1289 family)
MRPVRSVHEDHQVIRPNSPCIAVCTTLYDENCKGCGRTYMEVALWNEMQQHDKEQVWKRIDKEATAWRYNRYKDRVK